MHSNPSSAASWFYQTRLFHSWFEAMLLLSSPHFHGKKAIAAFGAAGSLNRWDAPDSYPVSSAASVNAPTHKALELCLYADLYPGRLSDQQRLFPGVPKLRRGDSFAVVKLCGNVSQRQQKGGGDGRLYSESMPELASAKMIIDAGSSDKIASTEMVDQLGRSPFKGRGKSTQSSCVAKDDSSMLFLLWLSQQAGLGCSTTYFFPLITTLAIGRSGDNSAIRKSDEDNSICSSRYTFLKIGPAPAIGFLSGGAESARSGKAKLTFWGGFL
ncbi:hypothetical protein Q3G72_003191 [Acer saccharum]|nr:hypothetical protein Q3G72_003191 [Acer saccharum]